MAAFLESTVRGLAPPPEPVIGAVACEKIQAEIAQLPARALLESAGDLRVYLTAASPIPQTLREIGRLREITFRAAGEGTGRAVDLDEFDARYLHLFVWNAVRREVVGGYRLLPVDRGGPLNNHALCRHKLYTHTLFHFDERFLAAMGPAVELGRSFVRVEYQKGLAPLVLLWKGIGRFVAAHPRYKTLFGPVSISNQYQAASRELIIAFLEAQARAAGWMDLVQGRHAPDRHGSELRCKDVDELGEIIRGMEPGRPGIPVLLRQYLNLGGKLLGFSVDPEFSNALDGLIVVDLTKTEPKLLERYLGRVQAQAFLAFHKENYCA